MLALAAYDDERLVVDEAILPAIPNELLAYY